MQLVGPVPNELYHRFVDFSFFVNRMFQPKGARGHVLHAALHRQHCQIYHFDEATEYGTLPGPGRDMARRFLDMAHWGEGDRIFTYIINLDGLMRFTETGKEFAIDLLSKHTMHSDVNVSVVYVRENRVADHVKTGLHCHLWRVLCAQVRARTAERRRRRQRQRRH
jgi:hypothetical protein